MVNAEQVIEIYEDMSNLTGQMLNAARARDWDTLVELESRCASHVQALRAGEGPVALEGERRERKITLLQKILADDRAIRDVTEPWLAELAALLSNSRLERKLNHAYGAQTAA
jgi:flagellar protein FliT